MHDPFLSVSFDFPFRVHPPVRLGGLAEREKVVPAGPEAFVLLFKRTREPDSGYTQAEEHDFGPSIKIPPPISLPAGIRAETAAVGRYWSNIQREPEVSLNFPRPRATTRAPFEDHYAEELAAIVVFSLLTARERPGDL